MDNNVPACVWPVSATLAEGPVWHAAENAFYFVDIKRCRLYRCNEDGGGQASWQAPGEIGFALPMAGGGLICGLPGRLATFSEDTGFTPLLALEASLPGNRLNDGYIDAQGRLWFGSMDNAEQAPSGSLYLYHAGDAGQPHHLRQMDSGICITNGPCASPDGKTFYHTDTLERTIYAYDLAPDGSLSNKREFVRIAGSGYPDGSVVDAEGHLWVGLFGGGRAERYAPDGALVAQVALPCSNVTKLAFGGADLRTVFVTTARKGLSESELEQQPLAGGVFTFRADAPGLPQHTFNRITA